MTSDVKDLVERLALRPGDSGGPSYIQMMRERKEAATALEAQAEEIARLREALEPFARAAVAIPSDDPGPFRLETLTGYRLIFRSDLDAARAALIDKEAQT